jgi:hypothetical protein
MNVTCPSCGEKGKIPKQLIGLRIKCKKCSASFLVSSPDAPAVDLEAPGPHSDAIEVQGLHASAWTVAAPEAGDKGPAHEPEAAVFTAAPAEPPPAGAAVKQYKLLTQKDKWFEGKFEVGRLEEALNHYARQGWVVRSMATPQILGYTGELREEIVVLLER